MNTIADRKVPSHEATYLRLRDMILTGRLVPGQAVTIQGLTQALDAGMTPVREAIRRLTAEGALHLHGNRRVSVPNLTAPLLDQVAFARLTIEPRIAELAAPRLTVSQIAELVRIDALIVPAIARHDISAYLTANHLFHFTLYEASGAQVLVDMAQSLWLRFGPSLRIVAENHRRNPLPDRHLDALSAMRAGDGTALAAAVRSDIEQGIEQVRTQVARGN